MKPRILLVEDELAISEPLAEGLEREGFETEVASTLEAARAAWERIDQTSSSSTSCSRTATDEILRATFGSGRMYRSSC